MASGPGDATAAGESEKEDVDVEAAKQARYISAFSPDDIPGAQESNASLEVAALMQQLEVLDNAAQRSVAAEVESAIEGGACLVDDAGRERILEICGDIHQKAIRLSRPERWRNCSGNYKRRFLAIKIGRRSDQIPILCQY